MTRRQIWSCSKVILISALLSVTLLLNLSACTTIPSEIPPPKLVKLLEWREELGYLGGPRKPTIAPNGYTYILTDYDGGLLILDGTEIVKLIPWSDLMDRGRGERIIAHPTNGLVYVVRGGGDRPEQGRIYVFQDAEHIETVEMLGTGVKDLVIDQSNGHLYVIMSSKYLDKNAPVNIIHVISGTELITTTLIPSLRTQRAVYNPVDGQLYLGQLASRNSPESLIALDPEHHTLMEPFRDLPVPLGPIKDMAIDRDSGDIYMIGGGGLIAKLTYWNRVNSPITLYVNPFGDNVRFSLEKIKYDQTRDLAYVTTTRDTIEPGIVLVMRKDQIIAEIPVGYEGSDIAIDEERNYVYVSNSYSRTLSVIRGTEVITTLHTHGRHPIDVTVDEKAGLVYVPNIDNSSMAIFGFEEQYSETALRWQSFFPLIKKEN